MMKYLVTKTVINTLTYTQEVFAKDDDHAIEVADAADDWDEDADSEFSYEVEELPLQPGWVVKVTGIEYDVDEEHAQYEKYVRNIVECEVGGESYEDCPVGWELTEDTDEESEKRGERSFTIRIGEDGKGEVWDGFYTTDGEIAIEFADFDDDYQCGPTEITIPLEELDCRVDDDAEAAELAKDEEFCAAVMDMVSDSTGWTISDCTISIGKSCA